jgi:hypothetical protein
MPNAVDASWLRYELDVVTMVQDAIQSYSQEFKNSQTDQILQVSIWTDPQALVSAVSFETVKHAVESIASQAVWCEENGFYGDAEILRGREYHLEVAGFKYSEYRTLTHDYLLAHIDAGDFTVEDAESVIETVLLRIVNRAKSERWLAVLPQGHGIWLGTSSPRDWYDHVTFIAP